MPQFRVWLHDEIGFAKPGYHGVEAETPKAAAEIVYGTPVNPHGPLHTLCARVASMEDMKIVHSDGFFRRPAKR